MKISWLSTIAGAAVVGVVFTTVVLITGPLWARPIWGTYWAWWDVRPEMLLTLFISLASFALLYLALVRSRYRYAVERDAIARATAHDA